MRCKIIGCGHSSRATQSSAGKTWTGYGICGCCALELGLVKRVSSLCRVAGTFRTRTGQVRHGVVDQYTRVKALEPEISKSMLE